MASIIRPIVSFGVSLGRAFAVTLIVIMLLAVALVTVIPVAIGLPGIGFVFAVVLWSAGAVVDVLPFVRLAEAVPVPSPAALVNYVASAWYLDHLVEPLSRHAVLTAMSVFQSEPGTSSARAALLVDGVLYPLAGYISVIAWGLDIWKHRAPHPGQEADATPPPATAQPATPQPATAAVRKWFRHRGAWGLFAIIGAMVAIYALGRLAGLTSLPPVQSVGPVAISAFFVMAVAEFVQVALADLEKALFAIVAKAFS